MTYSGPERRKDFKMREFHDLNQNSCQPHNDIIKKVSELAKSHYKYKDEQIARNEAYDLQIAQNAKGLEEQKRLRNHCKADALPNIRKSIEENKDEMCKVMNSFKTLMRDKLTETREEFIDKLNRASGNMRYLYGTSFLLSILLGWLFIISGNLHADTDKLSDRQTLVERTTDKLQTDVKYMREDIKDIKDSLKEILKRLPPNTELSN